MKWRNCIILHAFWLSLQCWSWHVSLPTIIIRDRSRRVRAALAESPLKSSSPFDPSDFIREEPANRNGTKDTGSNYDPKKIVEANLREFKKQQALDEVSKYKRGRGLDSMEDWDARPTGYGREDEEDMRYFLNRTTADGRQPSLEEEMFRMRNVSASNESMIVQFIKDVYVGSADDSPRRQQARFVLRSISVLCLLIGVVFTAVWYLAPGKFISIRGDRDFSQNYQMQQYEDPAELLLYQSPQDAYGDNNNPPPLSDDTSSPQQSSEKQRSDFLDDGVGVPENSLPRIPLEKKILIRVPKNTIQL